MTATMHIQTSHRSWLCAIALAVFDLDSGQKTEACVPEGELSSPERQAIAYGSFPEARAYTSDAKNGICDSSYMFRICRSKTHADGEDAKYLYCYVCARQCRDERLHRGADQRSIILISEYPYSSIISPLAAILGPALFPSFRSAAAEVMHACSLLWPPPVPGTLAHLTVGPHRVVGRIPLDACLSDNVDPASRRDAHTSPAVSSLPMCGSFCEPVETLELLLVHSKQLWKLWEVMLLAHPIMVFSCSAAHSSAAVCALVSLIAPVPYSEDYRPLLSIHDPAAQAVSDTVRRSMVQERGPHGMSQPPPTAIGVTNPYFLRAFEHCPNVMTIMHDPSALMPVTAEAPQLSQAQPGMLSTLFTASGSFHPDLLAGKLDSLSMQRGLLCSGQDRSVLQKLKAAIDGPTTDTVAAACHVLRNHFHHLTVSFLLAFYEFLERPCPWAATRQVFGSSSKRTEEFSVKEFLQFLEGYSIPETVVNIAGSKRKAQALYQAFVQSGNFLPWLNRVMRDSVGDPPEP